MILLASPCMYERNLWSNSSYNDREPAMIMKNVQDMSSTAMRTIVLSDSFLISNIAFL